MKNSVFALALLLTGTLSFASIGKVKDVKEPTEPVKTNFSKSETDTQQPEGWTIYCVDLGLGEEFCCESPDYNTAQKCAREKAMKALEDLEHANEQTGQVM